MGVREGALNSAIFAALRRSLSLRLWVHPSPPAPPAYAKASAGNSELLAAVALAKAAPFKKGEGSVVGSPKRGKRCGGFFDC
jgi:hypothetical protein